MAKNTGGKVGSDPEAARRFVSRRDFGAPEEDRVEREYASSETRRNDPGSGTARSGPGTRTSGVGGNESGRGSSSGGDVDADDAALIGIGDPNVNPSRPQAQPSIGASQRPTLNPPVVDLNDPARAGELDTDASTSAADVNNDEDAPGFEGDLTADEATGGA
jgi:hypothetical protein